MTTRSLLGGAPFVGSHHFNPVVRESLLSATVESVGPIVGRRGFSRRFPPSLGDFHQEAPRVTPWEKEPYGY